jgi:hypothetical protein
VGVDYDLFAMTGYFQEPARSEEVERVFGRYLPEPFRGVRQRCGIVEQARTSIRMRLPQYPNHGISRQIVSGGRGTG